MAITSADKLKGMNLGGSMALVQTTIQRFKEEVVDGKVAATEKGAASGVATLDANGLVPQSQLPSYVDDVIELLAITDTAPATCAKDDLYFNTSTKKIVRATGTNTWGTSAATNTNPETGKIYVDLSNDKSFRWGGTAMVEISKSLVIGTTQGTAADGKALNDHTTDSTIHVTSSDKTAWNGKQDALAFNTAYDAATNKVATMADVGTLPENVACFSNDTGEGVIPSDGIKAETVSAGATISVNPDVVTVISGNVGTAAITLQVPSDNLAHVWDILMTTGSSVNVTFATSTSATIKKPSGFEVGASKSCEVSVIGVGSTYYLRYGEFA